AQLRWEILIGAQQYPGVIAAPALQPLQVGAQRRVMRGTKECCGGRRQLCAEPGLVEARQVTGRGIEQGSQMAYAKSGSSSQQDPRV
ncbi:MAG: hypothetical protein JOZ93_08270, partial [Sinobacteraceae bacterium]|nr:hypothetical protein [Nevskiaceae bacterium]